MMTFPRTPSYCARRAYVWYPRRFRALDESRSSPASATGQTPARSWDTRQHSGRSHRGRTWAGLRGRTLRGGVSSVLPGSPGGDRSPPRGSRRWAPCRRSLVAGRGADEEGDSPTLPSEGPKQIVTGRRHRGARGISGVSLHRCLGGKLESRPFAAGGGCGAFPLLQDGTAMSTAYARGDVVEGVPSSART